MAKIKSKQDSQSAQPRRSTDLVRAYLLEIGRVPLLTKEQEILYGKQVQQMIAMQVLQDNLARERNRQPTLSEWAAEANLSKTKLEQIQQEGQRAMQRMMEANLRLVVSIAKKYQKRNLELLDLIQEGTFGLKRAVEKFEPSRGFRFSTYAYWWIRQAITRAVAHQSRTIRLPIHVTEKLNKIKKKQQELSQHLGHSPTPDEIAQAMELEPTQIRDYLMAARRPMSLEQLVGDNQDTELQELLAEDGLSPEHYAAGEALRTDINQLLYELTPQQREIVTLRFGLQDDRELSLAKIGKKLSISRERVRQLEQQALDYLKHRTDVREYLAS